MMLAKKIGMTQVFDKNGDVLPVTVVVAGPCIVVQKNTKDKNGYSSVQLGFEEVADKKISKPLVGHFKKSGVKTSMKFLREFVVSPEAAIEVGQVITVESFKAGDIIKVTGFSKGRGFQGVIKRHGKAGGPASHGSRFHRTTGSIGQRTSPGEVFKNMKLPGHMGDRRVTVRGLEVVSVQSENHLLFIKGAVPGAKNNFLMIHKES